MPALLGPRVLAARRAPVVRATPASAEARYERGLPWLAEAVAEPAARHATPMVVVA
jgi:hypothetical protein